MRERLRRVLHLASVAVVMSSLLFVPYCSEGKIAEEALNLNDLMRATFLNTTGSSSDLTLNDLMRVFYTRFKDNVVLTSSGVWQFQVDVDMNNHPIKNLSGVGIGTNTAPVVRTATVVVAANDAATAAKAQADYVCDGTDDQVEIQAAIDGLPAKGGIIHLSEGIFYIGDTIALEGNGYQLGRISLIGSGPESTYLKLEDGVNKDMMKWTDTGSTRYFYEIKEMSLNGNKANNTSGTAIYLDNLADVRLENLYIFEFAEDGICTTNCWGYKIINVVVEWCDRYGIYLQGGGEAYIAGCHITSNFKNLAFSTVNGVSVVGGQYGRSEKEAIQLFSGADNNIFVGLYLNDPVTAGGANPILIQGTNNIFKENVIDCKKNSGYAIELSSTASGNIISDNQLTNYGVGAIYEAVPGANRVYEAFSDHFQDCQVASTTYVHAAITGTGGEQEITTNITNPDVPRNISIAATNNASPSGDVTIEGIDAKGNSITENITIVAGGTAYGDKAFATVTKIIIPAGVSSADTVSVGISDKVGLSHVVYETSDVYKVKRNNADATGDFDMASDVDTTYGTLDLSSLSGGLSAGDDITIWYRSNLNIID